MAARFPQGMSIQSTRQTSASSPPRNTVHGSIKAGMPGFVKSGQSASMGGAKGGSGSGPKREGPIGKRGSSGAKGLNKPAPGTSTKSYRSDSTGHAGRIERMKALTSFEGRRKSNMY